MTDDDRLVGGDKPRAPRDHHLTGTGTPRSADDGVIQPPPEPASPVDEEILTGATASGQPAGVDELTINRSGSGGSGGPVEPDASVEGSGGQSLSELLGSEEEREPPRR